MVSRLNRVSINCCCNTVAASSCSFCQSGTTPLTLKIIIPAGQFEDIGNCTECPSISGTYLLSQTSSNACHWLGDHGRCLGGESLLQTVFGTSDAYLTRVGNSTVGVFRFLFRDDTSGDLPPVNCGTLNQLTSFFATSGGASACGTSTGNGQITVTNV